jgi:type I restriction enzyme, S subunit
MSNWDIKELGEVCQFFNGQAHEKCINENGKYKLINSKFVSSEGEIFKRTDKALSPLYKDDIVMVMSDVPNGKTIAKCFLVDEDDTYTLNQRICVIRSNKFDIKFLFYQLNRNKYFLSFDNGENQTNLRKDDILKCKLFVPPLQEQQRIVTILDEAFSVIDKAKANTEQNLKNAKELFESELQRVFSEKGDGWEEKRLGDVFNMKPQKKEAKEKLHEDDLVTFLPMEDLDVLNKNIASKKEKKLKEVTSSYTYFADNDLLMAKITPCFENGKLGIARNLKNGVGFGSSEYIVFRELGVVTQDYLFYFLSRNIVREVGKKLMTGAVGHKRVSKDWIENYIIPFPKSLKDQQTIVSKMDALREQTKKLEAVYSTKLQDLEELKKSVLSKAFSGEL